MKKLLRNALLPLGGVVLLASVATAQKEVYIDESMDGWSPPQTAASNWTVDSITGAPEDWEVREEDPDGTVNKSVWSRGYNFIRTEADNYYPLADNEIIPTNDEPVVFSYRFYEFMDREEGDEGQLRNFVELGQAADPLRLFAFGVWDGSNTHYQIRNYPQDGWVMLDVERTVGWHEVLWVFNADSFDLYFDGDLVLGSRGYSTVAAGFDQIKLGSGYARVNESFLYDDVYLAKDPGYAADIIINKQPGADYLSPMASSDFGETFSFSVEAEGGVAPLTYEWYHNGELVTNDARISGAETDTLTIEGTDGPDSGEYYVDIKDSGVAVERSTTARLLALVEHEVILAGKDLPAEAINGTWTVPKGGWHGSDRYTSMTDDASAEKTVTFQPELTETGWYEVSTYFIPSYVGDNRTTEAPFFVHNADGENLVIVNQQNLVGSGGADWVSVGTFEFEEGADGKIVISNVYQQDETPDRFGTLVFAGAVRWTPTEAPATGDGDGPSIAISRTETGGIELLIEGEPETEYTVESVDNLGDDWTVLGSETTDPSGSAIFTDSAAGDAPRRFYRVIVQ